MKITAPFALLPAATWFCLALMPETTAAQRISFDRYHDNSEFTETLQGLARDFPRLMKLEEVGRSVEGRPIWGVTLTNWDTGLPEHKPAMYVDGNTHAGELAGGEAALHLVLRLTTGYGSDPLVTEAMDNFTYYVLPRVNPDGSEIIVTGRYPDNPNPTDDDGDGRFDEDPVEDLNGDGVISTMRIRDPDGSMCTHREDARLLVECPGGQRGQWRVVGQEGIDNDDDGRLNEDGPEGLGSVSNRNYPVGWWSRDELQHGRGKYPLSEPEAKAQVDFILAHPNINGLTTYHTHSGIILRPYAHKADDVHLAADLPYFEGIGRVGTDITGYGLVSSYHSFTPNPLRPRLGTFKDWGYVHRGLISWTIELWKAPGEEGLSAFEGLDEVKLLEFVDRELGGQGFVSWKRYDHPTLGEVEIGGYDGRFLVQNPPPSFLEQEVEKVTHFAIVQGMMSARVRVTEVVSSPVQSDIFRVTASVQNQGYLPTAIPRAVSLGLNRPVRVVLEGADVISDNQSERLGVLPGTADGAPTRTVTWIVKGQRGSQISVEAISERGGRHRVTHRLGQS